MCGLEKVVHVIVAPIAYEVFTMTCSISQKFGRPLPFVYVSPVSNQFETDVNRLVSAVVTADLSDCPKSFVKVVGSITVSELNTAVYDLVKGGEVLASDVRYLSPVGYIFGVKVLCALSAVGGAVGYIADRALSECNAYCTNDGDNIQCLESVAVESHVLDSLVWLACWYSARCDVLADKLRQCGKYDIMEVDKLTCQKELEKGSDLLTCESVGMLGGIVSEYLDKLKL